MLMDVMDIQKILPLRYLFLLVDRVTELNPKESIVAYKNVSISEPVFEGHFPGHPIFSGSLTCSWSWPILFISIISSGYLSSHAPIS